MPPECDEDTAVLKSSSRHFKLDDVSGKLTIQTIRECCAAESREMVSSACHRRQHQQHIVLEDELFFSPTIVCSTTSKKQACDEGSLPNRVK